MNEEKSKCNWLERSYDNFPVFYFAKDITTIVKHKNLEQTFVVRPSKFRRLIAILFICLRLFGWFSVFLLVIQNILLPISIVSLLLVTVWIGLVLWTFFLNPKWSYKIFIDKDKIKLGKQAFEWGDITEYLLMEKGGGRRLVTTLVLFTDKSVFKYNLTNLNKSGQEIIKRIEFYKQ
ncbi:MAG: hypothetical protein GC178_15085 [Flavobacteriales bacterium]|nr:hypothetical protein [Flavobacteriales bacterium]